MTAQDDMPGARRGLIGWFIANPVAANLLMLVLLVGGALSALNLRSQVFPTISPGTVVVTWASCSAGTSSRCLTKRSCPCARR